MTSEYLVFAAAALASIAIVAGTTLKGWQGWLTL